MCLEGKAIDCHGRGFDVMPALQPGHYSHTKLSIHHNNIRTIQDGQLLIPSLKTLHLFHNALTRVPADVSHLHHLEYLSLHQNNIEIIDDVTYPNTLDRINAERNNIKTITLIKFNGNDPSNNKLHTLKLAMNPLTNIAADAFKYLKNLRWLDLSKTRLTRLPLALADLSRLSRLDILDVPDLECTCEESSLRTWPDDRFGTFYGLVNFQGKCGKFSISEFLVNTRRVEIALKCPAS